MSELRHKISELEERIRYHQELYYTGKPEISDADFDDIWDELRKIDPENTVFLTINSEFSDGFAKREHIIPMGSQDKAANPEEFETWAKKMPFDTFLVQYKLDGASLELQYRNGRFLCAVTRGNGKIGDDISFNARKMKGVLPELLGDAGPLGLNPFTGGVRGEVIMSHEVHSTYFSDKANCRNAANGLMKRKDGNGCEHLEVICYDAALVTQDTSESKNSPFTNEVEKLEWLKNAGFTIVPLHICEGSFSVIEYRAHVMDIRETLAYDIDGLVVKGLEIDPIDLARPRPEKQIAFKFSLEEAITTLREVFWNESGATYTPIAITDPVQLAGTTVQRANLVNPNMIANLKLRIGSRVLVTKRGEIIPKIEALVENPSDSIPIIQPNICSTCNTTLKDEGTRLFCPNTECPKLIHHRLEKWISVLDIRDFGIGLIKRLFDSKRVRSIPDLYTLTVAELAELDRMGQVSAEKVLKSLYAKKTISLPSFVAGFDIDGIGETMVEKLVLSGFDTIDKLFNASETDFAQVNQFGQILAKALSLGLLTLRKEMETLLASGSITIAAPISNGIFTGKSFCFTGELVSMKRSEAEAIIKTLGGSVKSSVVKGLTYLVTNTPESGSSKNIKARSLGVSIISEDSFLSLTKGNI
ncbi:MAG TPA: NAD-dependent DNA ligase LigA [Treponemataceae bacterium]|nr:NAD-dependent DNA ligase LigA [Treponemataceae bacterium]